MLINEWDFPILVESTEQYFPGAQSSSLMVNSGDGAFGAFCCLIYILQYARHNLCLVVCLTDFYTINMFLILFIFWRARVCFPLLCLVTHFVFFRDVWIRTQRAAVAISRVSNLATHLPPWHHPLQVHKNENFLASILNFVLLQC